MTTTPATVPRPRRLPWTPLSMFNLLLAGWCVSVMLIYISALTVEAAMRETRELRALCPSPGVVMMNAGPALVSDHTRIMMCDGETCRPSQ